ncbi:hypothetical protein RHGRI_023932 [Rhododendron griersonianum]|uniref:Transmembrane protein n=1 Tax=Rhododendron griersonianum TaxID=479676 RepID=A0AAV6J5H9_9ERIC|nr:hypothetical protein RHGRI_023932 [Rhododendron griersonianum]
MAESGLLTRWFVGSFWDVDPATVGYSSSPESILEVSLCVWDRLVLLCLEVQRLDRLRGGGCGLLLPAGDRRVAASSWVVCVRCFLGCGVVWCGLGHFGFWALPFWVFGLQVWFLINLDCLGFFFLPWFFFFFQSLYISGS